MPHPTQLVEMPDLLRLALIARATGGGILAEERPQFPMGGSELSGYRDYCPGDDWRHIDWSVCARHDELRVRQYAGRPDRHVRVLLDCSASMGQGTTRPPFETARRIATALGYVALDQQSQLSVITFSDRVERRIGPFRGKGRAARLMQEMASLTAPHGRTDLRSAAELLVRTDRAVGPVVVVSDICDPDSFKAGLDILRLSGFSPRVVHLVDPHDDELVPGDVELIDAESGESWQAVLTPRQLRAYHDLVAEDHEKPRRYCARFRLSYVRVSAEAGEHDVLRDVLAKRTRLP